MKRGNEKWEARVAARAWETSYIERGTTCLSSPRHFLGTLCPDWSWEIVVLQGALAPNDNRRKQ